MTTAFARNGMVLCAFASWTLLLVFLARGAERHASTRVRSQAWMPVGLCIPLIGFAAWGHHDPAAFAKIAACIALVVAAVSDVRTGYLFDAITFPAAVFSATLAVIGHAGGAAAAGVLLLTAIFGTIVATSRGRAMGFGDVKAMYAIGAAFGPLESVVVLFAASISGIVSSRFASARGNDARQIPFGIHLAFGSTFALIAGDALLARIAGR